MSYSSLATKSILSPNYKKRTHKIDCVSIHCPCGIISLDSMGEIYKKPENNASANYGIDVGGNIAVFVDEKNASVCTSNTGADNRSITIQVSAMSNQSPYPLSEASYQALSDLLVDICIRNNINSLKWKNDAKYGVAAANGGPVDDQNMFIHPWFSKKRDPGEWLLKKHPELVQMTNTQLVIKRENMRKVIFIGDERAEQVHRTIGTDLNLWFTKQTQAYSWIGSPLPFESEINNRSAICIMGGGTDPNYISAKEYASRINAYAQSWFSSGCAVYYASITPVSRTGYGNITNAKIEKFNAEMKQNLSSGIGYLDVYGSIKDSFIVTDGYHYDTNTNKEIYSAMIQQASRLRGDVHLNLNLNLDPTTFHPYVAKFDRNASVNYKALSDLRVTGAIIEAGYRYNTNGSRTEKFDNPNIKTQISALDSFSIPYGMYTICRATSVATAKIEIDYFQYQLYRHPPKLGAWLQLENLSGNLSQNDLLLTQYNTQLANLGFRSRMGIICTRKDLTKISWNKWQDEFYLYLVEHLTDLSVLDNLLDPALFDIDGTTPTTITPTVISNSSTDTSSSSTTYGDIRDDLPDYVVNR